MEIGIVEGFFGPAWKDSDRRSYAQFLKNVGGNFYIYAPKQDPQLRKAWREDWDKAYLTKLSDLKNSFNFQGIKFGVGFSPFGLGTKLMPQDLDSLEEKLRRIDEIGVQTLGLFFDDMPTNANLAATQIETLKIVKKHFHQQVIFCPTYYTYDPILEKVFGKMPENYLSDIAAGVPLDTSIAWTGPKVISPEIPAEHLVGVSQLLKRRPFIWENLFANDGPKNCKFLKLKPYTGRDAKTAQHSEAFGFNMMNQAQLSKITFLASKLSLSGMAPEQAFVEAVESLCSEGFAKFIMAHRLTFLEKGLDQIDVPTRARLLDELSQLSDASAKEIRDWLEDKYTVGSECLTD